MGFRLKQIAQWAPLVAGGALLGGCALVVDFSDYYHEEAASSSNAGSGGAGGATGGGGAGGAGGATGGGGAGGAGGCVGVDFMTDAENCGVCGRSCLGGACEAGQCGFAEIAKGAPGSVFGHVLIDPAEDLVYWADSGNIQSAPRSTYPVVPTLVASATGADFIVADATRLYWSVFGDQGSIAMLVKGAPNPMNLATMQSNPVGLAVSQGYVYWAEYTGGSIKKAINDGSMMPEVLKTGEPLPFFVAADGNEVFWTFRGDGALGGINKLNAPDPLVTGVPSPAGIALDETHVYWIGKDGAVQKTPRAGNPAVTFLANLEEPAGVELFAGEIVVDKTHVYWTGKNSLDCNPCGKIYRVPKDGSPMNVEVFADDTSAKKWGALRSIAMDDKAVYWTTGVDRRLFRKLKPLPMMP